MKNRIFSTMALVALVGCSDSTGLEPVDLDGTWTAQTWTFTNPANTSQTAEVISLGGAFSLTLRADETFSLALNVGEIFTITGTYTTTAASITLAESGQGSPMTWGVVRDGSTMTFTTSDGEWDWDDDGNDEPATEVIVLTK